MAVMNVYDIDILDFINAKSQDTKKLDHFNLSVMVDDDFVTSAKNHEEIYLHYPVYDENGFILKDSSKWKYKKKVNAYEIWNTIIKQAYNNGEPGVFFYDNLNKDNNLWYIENIVGSNPCGEYVAGTVYGKNPITNEELNKSDFGGACNLGSLFLHNFIKNPFKVNAQFDYETLKKSIYSAVRFLDNIIDINKFPDKIYENYQKSFRTIGLGFTGLADALVMMNLKYNSKEAQLFTFDLTNFIAMNIYKASIELAKEKGSFPLLDREKFVQSGFITKHCECYSEWEQIRKDILQYGIRNSKMISIAPTGTLSLTFGNNCSSGLEPIFSLEYERKIKMGGQQDDDTKIVKMQDYAYGEWLKIKDESDTIVKKDKFITALEMTVEEHINMLKNIAYNTDMSCSKTINVPEEYNFEQTKKIYDLCHDSGIKGCTIFRPNSIRTGILISEQPKEKEEKLDRGIILEADDNCIGRKRTLHTGCGTLHCEAFFDPDTGELLETYFSKGSSGGCNNFMIGLSRMISLAARGGIDIYSIVDQLNSSGTCPAYATRTAVHHDTSKGSCCPVAIGNALIDMYNEVHNDLFDDEDESIQSQTQKTEEIKIQPKSKDKSKCPECGEPLIFEGGCMTCKSCGWTKCE